MQKVKVLNVCVDVESVPFNKGFYSVDMTFYFLVEMSVYLSPGTPAVNCCGISYFSKKVILYGSEANARVFSSHAGCCNGNEQLTAMPNAVVQIVDPICLASRYVECPAKTCCPGAVIPCQICSQVGGNFQEVSVSKEVYITLGLFTIVQLQRKVQMMVPRPMTSASRIRRANTPPVIHVKCLRRSSSRWRISSRPVWMNSETTTTATTEQPAETHRESGPNLFRKRLGPLLCAKKNDLSQTAAVFFFQTLQAFQRLRALTADA